MKMYFCMMRNSWGRGKTRDEALKNARREGGCGNRTTPRIIWEYDDEKTKNVGLDDLGFNLLWEGEKPVLLERVMEKGKRK